ncbi:hypothetical protein Vretimale_15386, partial [Volvox reticuliferus]
LKQSTVRLSTSYLISKVTMAPKGKVAAAEPKADAPEAVVETEAKSKTAKAPKKEKKAPKKVPKEPAAVGEGDKKAKKKAKIAKSETYKLYIYKVLKQVHPDT